MKQLWYLYGGGLQYADGWTNLSPTQSGEHNIFERGCLRAGEEWVEANLASVAGVAVGLAITQVLHLNSTFSCQLTFSHKISNLQLKKNKKKH